MYSQLIDSLKFGGRYVKRHHWVFEENEIFVQLKCIVQGYLILQVSLKVKTKVICKQS